jgi:hypothetical protein
MFFYDSTSPLFIPIIFKGEIKKMNIFRSELVLGAEFCGPYEIPALKRSNYIIKRLVSFEKRKSVSKEHWIHFYIQDEKFQSIWNNPKRYLNVLQKFDGIITPDFSVYRDFPLVLQAYNVYRSRALGYWWQKNGVKIIPNIRWGDERTYEFAFAGIEQGGTVAVGTLGGLKNPINRKYFFSGFNELLKRIQPDTIIIYGATPDRIKSQCSITGINILQFDCQFDVSHNKKVA